MKYLKLNDVVFYSFLIWILISGGLKVDNFIFWIGNFTLLSLFFIGLLYSKYLSYLISKQYGKVLSNYNDPKPFTSMINAISKAGYKANDIKEIDFISYDLNQSCNYIKPIAKRLVSTNDTIKINIIGYGDKASCQDISNDNLNYFPLDIRLSEHKNLVYMDDGTTFLWYEPNHKIKDNTHYFKGGGYFIEPAKDSLVEIESYISSLKA